MPVLKLRRLKGQSAELAAKPGRPLLLNFWATWSDASQAELPKLENLQKLAGKDLDFAAIAEDGGGDYVVEPFLRKQEIKHLPIFLDPDGNAIATASPTRPAGPFVLYSTPMTYLVSRQGMIAGYIASPVDWTLEVVQTLLDYLAQS